MVEVSSLTHKYASRTALRAVSFDVTRGHLFGLLGPNGGGKTTLFKILTTLITPTGGEARIDGLSVVQQRAAVRRKIGVVFQHPSLDPKLTVRENLMHQGHLYGLSGAQLRRRSEFWLDRFGLADRGRDFVETLSGGLQRRVEVAKALLHEPAVLILDEPSTGLDPGARAALMATLHQLRDEGEVTILLTTHLMDEADRCDELAVLDEGNLVALDSPGRLKESIGGDILTVDSPNPTELSAKVSDRFKCEVEVVDGLLRIERSDGHTFVPQLVEAFPGEIESITVGKPTLDDVFLHLTGHRLWEGNGGVRDAGRSRRG